ncbi:MAG: CCA tRNA nucleotidyltransferase [Rhodospirillales bacterium]|nr:CCA tRNA nucleotidyltransferase [Rhodospirillales bacterium]
MSGAPALTLAPPPAFLADPALRAVLTALPEARLVGGAVRDALAGRPVADVDLATPRPPADVMAALAAAGLKAVPTGIDHGTVTAVSGHRGFEVTTLRHDLSTDGRHAEVAFTDDWQADAARRDFTINAMSMAANGAVFDYFGGISDLRAGRVRFVGQAATRIAEDYLRILRFFRFWARYGAGAADAEAVAAIAAAVPGLRRLSAERVWMELKRILAAPDPRGAVALMQQLGVLAAVLPEGTAPLRLAALVARGTPADPMLRLAALLDGDATALAVRLKLSAAERDRLRALRAAPALPPQADDDALRRALAGESREVLLGRVWLAGGDADLLARLSAMPAPAFPLRGRDLRAAGVPAGPEMGALLRALRDWWLAGGCTGDVRAELRRRTDGVIRG